MISSRRAFSHEPRFICRSGHCPRCDGNVGERAPGSCARYGFWSVLGAARADRKDAIHLSRQAVLLVSLRLGGRRLVLVRLRHPRRHRLGWRLWLAWLGAAKKKPRAARGSRVSLPALRLMQGSVFSSTDAICYAAKNGLPDRSQCTKRSCNSAKPTARFRPTCP